MRTCRLFHCLKQQTSCTHFPQMTDIMTPCEQLQCVQKLTSTASIPGVPVHPGVPVQTSVPVHPGVPVHPCIPEYTQVYLYREVYLYTQVYTQVYMYIYLTSIQMCSLSLTTKYIISCKSGNIKTHLLAKQSNSYFIKRVVHLITVEIPFPAGIASNEHSLRHDCI